jgi:hypothetical protein
MEESSENEKFSKSEKPGDEIHYHYHMDRPGYPGSEPTHPVQERKPGEVHYHYYYEPPRIPKRKSSKPTIAGALMIMHAIVTFVAIGILIPLALVVGNMGEGFEFFGMGDNADITGTVIFNDGTPAANVTISIEGEPLSTLTNENGEYFLYNVPTGNQEIRVEKEGYNTIIYKAFINPSDSNQENGNDRKKENEFNFTITPGDQIIERGSHPPLELIGIVMLICAGLSIILAIISLVGGIYAIRRERYKIAIVGAIVGVITLGLLSLIALFILILAKDEFKEKKDIPEQVTLRGGEVQ